MIINPTNQTATVLGNILTFVNFDFSNFFNISNVIQQPPTNVDNNTNINANTNISPSVNQNINDLINQTTQEFNTNIGKLKINPFCAAG